MAKTRASKAASGAAARDDSQPLASQSAIHTEPASRRKRVRNDRAENKSQSAPTAAAKTQTRRKGKTSKLQQLPLLPLELLNLVFSFVQPYDLLRLCRTTKILRKMLLSRDSRPTWVASLACVSQLPECPADMSEPAFTQLIFDERCTECYDNDKVRILWMLRIQLCQSCFEKRRFICVTNPEFSTKYPCLSQHDLRLLLPRYNERSWFIDARRNDLFLHEDCQTLEGHLKSLTPHSEEYQDFVKSRQESMRGIVDHANECEKWRHYNLRKGVRRQELKEAKDRRKIAIMARLDLAGYGQISRWILEVDRYPYMSIKNDFLKLKMWKDPKDLTDRIWANAQPAAVKFIEKYRSSYETARWEFLVGFRTELLGIAAEVVVDDVDIPAGLSVPRLAELKAIPAIQELLERPLDENGQDTVQPEEILTVLHDLGPQALVDICTAHCRQLMLEKVQVRGDGTAHLELSTSVFKCAVWGCWSGLMTHHQLAIHRCWHTGRGKWGYGDSYQESWGWADLERLSRIKKVAGRTSEGVQDITGDFNPCDTAYEVIQVMLRAVHMDHSTTTFADLDAKDPWFSCSCDRCLKETSMTQKCVFDWRHLVSHLHTPTFYFDMDDYDYDQMITLITEIDANRARDLREGTHVELPPADSKVHQQEAVWRCTHCNLDPVTAPYLRQHALKRHNIEDPHMSLDYEPSLHCLGSARSQPIVLSS